MKWKYFLIVLFLSYFVLSVHAATTTIGFKEKYVDSVGNVYDFNAQNLAEHPLYNITDRGRYYVISRFEIWEDLPKQITCAGREIEVRYSFYPEKIVPQIKLDNYSQISDCVTKVNPTIWYWTLPFNAAAYRSITDDLIDMGAFKRTTKVIVTDSNKTCGLDCPEYSVVPKVIDNNIRLYFNPQTYSNVVYPLFLTENTITISNATFWSTQDCGDGFWSAYGGGSCATPLNSSIHANLSGYWDMESTSGTTEHGIKYGRFPDSTIAGTFSGNGTGSLNYTSGKLWGNALNTDGSDDYLRISDTLNFTDVLSISSQMYWKSEFIGFAGRPINKWTGTTDANFVMYFYGTTSGINRTIQYNANSGGVWGSISDVYTTSLNQWYNIALSYNSASGGQLYVNDSAIGGLLGSGTLATNSNPLYLGGQPGYADFVNSTFDEIFIVNSSQPIFSNSTYATSWNKTFLNNTAPVQHVVTAVKFNIYNTGVQNNTANISARQNGTSIWTQIATNYAGDNATWINGSWWQNTDFVVNVSGNGSSRAFIISMTYDEAHIPVDINGYVNNTLGAFVDGALVTINGASTLSRHTYQVNNTDLCNYNHSTLSCDGSRQSGVNYTASTNLQLIVFAHANAVNTTADVIVNIDGTNVTYNTGRPLGGAEQSYKSAVIIVPVYSNYTVYLANYHHYEWREYPLVHGYYNLTSEAGIQSVLARQVGYANFTDTLNASADMSYNITLSEKETVSEDLVIDYSLVGAIIGGLLAFVLLRRKHKDDDYKYKRE